MVSDGSQGPTTGFCAFILGSIFIVLRNMLPLHSLLQGKYDLHILISLEEILQSLKKRKLKKNLLCE